MLASWPLALAASALMAELALAFPSDDHKKIHKPVKVKYAGKHTEVKHYNQCVKLHHKIIHIFNARHIKIQHGKKHDKVQLFSDDNCDNQVKSFDAKGKRTQRNLVDKNTVIHAIKILPPGANADDDDMADYPQVQQQMGDGPDQGSGQGMPPQGL